MLLLGAARLLPPRCLPLSRRFTSARAARRNIHPVAGRSRVVQRFAESAGAAEKAAGDAAVEAEVMKRVAQVARDEADAAANKVKGGFFQRNKQGLTHALWSFVMVGLGAQVVSMTYRKNDAEKRTGAARDELATLRHLVNPYGAWFRETCDKAGLDAAQRASLTMSFEGLDVAAVSEEQVAMVLKSAGMDASSGGPSGGAMGSDTSPTRSNSSSAGGGSADGAAATGKKTKRMF